MCHRDQQLDLGFVFSATMPTVRVLVVFDEGALVSEALSF
jgi:hypothetical protein